MVMEGARREMTHVIQVKSTEKTSLIDMTRPVEDVVKRSGVREGACHIFIPHTTAAVTINENADPSVMEDILMGLDRIVPSEGRYRHLEGNSPAHIKSSLVG